MSSSVVRSGSWSRLVPALGLCVALSAPALGKTVEGVNMPDTLPAGDKTLTLNGAGMRIKKVAFVKAKVYVGGLYLEAPSKDGGAVLAADTARAVRLQFVRDVGKDKMIEAFREGFDQNAKDKATAQKANVDKLLALTPDTKEGDVWLFTYVPGKGTTLSFAGKDAGVIEGKDFADVLFSLWLGPKPPTEELKKAMLGG